jgi:hypothetical protein
VFGDPHMFEENGCAPQKKTAEMRSSPPFIFAGG